MMERETDRFMNNAELIAIRKNKTDKSVLSVSLSDKCLFKLLIPGDICKTPDMLGEFPEYIHLC